MTRKGDVIRLYAPDYYPREALGLPARLFDLKIRYRLAGGSFVPSYGAMIAANRTSPDSDFSDLAELIIIIKGESAFESISTRCSD
jgi:hypothetical protein